MAGIAPPLGAVWAVVAVLVPTALRWAIDRGASGVPFVTYFPAVVLAALFLGWRWGAAVAVVSAVVANWLFVGEPWDFSLYPLDLLAIALFGLTCAGLIWIGEMVRRLLRELEDANAREEILNAELMHRIKNMLATVNAMAVLTARHSEPGAFSEAFTGRMRALDRATELLGTGRDVHCEVARLVDAAIAPFRTDGNFEVDGPVCELPRDACVPLSLALHELCTNAAKHGALTVPEGKVLLTWACDHGGLLTIDWREEGGPPVSTPQRTGMGTQLLRRQRGLKGVNVDFRREGLVCRICIEDVEPGDSPSRAAADARPQRF